MNDITKIIFLALPVMAGVLIGFFMVWLMKAEPVKRKLKMDTERRIVADRIRIMRDFFKGMR